MDLHQLSIMHRIQNKTVQHILFCDIYLGSNNLGKLYVAFATKNEIKSLIIPQYINCTVFR